MGVTPTSGYTLCGEIPFSAKGSPLVDLRRAATNSPALNTLLASKQQVKSLNQADY